MPIYSQGAYLGALSGGGGETPEPTNLAVKEINSDAQLPDLVGGYAELEANTLYRFAPNLYTKPLKASQTGVAIVGTGVFSDGVFFTGTLPWLTIENASTSVRDISVTSGTASKFIEAVGTGIDTLSTTRLRLRGPIPLGDINGISPVFRDFVALGFSDGFTFSSAASTFRGLSFVNGLMLDSGVGSEKHFNLEDALFSDFEILDVIMDGAGTCISSSVGATSNLVTGLEADVKGVTFGSGAMTPLVGFTEDWQTNQWKFEGNSPSTVVDETRYFCDQFLVLEPGQGTISIPVASSDTFYDIGTPNPLEAVFSSDVAAHFTPQPDGSVLYTGYKPIPVEIIATATLEQQGGGQDLLECQIAVNWVAAATGIMKSRSLTQNTSQTTLTMTAATNINPLDNIRLIFCNKSDNSNIIVDAVKFEIGGR